MNNPFIKIYLTDNTGLNYYVATQNGLGIYSVITTTTKTPIMVLPKGWEGVKIGWDRDPLYLGVFRSQSQTFKFVKDARAVLLSLYYASGGGIQCEVTMRIDQFQDVVSGYNVAYKSQINFAQIDDVKFNPGLDNNPNKEGEFSAGTLDSLLFEYFQSNCNTKFNIPIWVLDPISGEYQLNDAVFVLHNGIKLLYQANYNSSAGAIKLNGSYEPKDVLWYTVSGVPPYSPSGYQLNGWNNGAIGDGYHVVPSFTKYSIAQNNGSTTFIGNDILTPFLIQGDQIPGSANFASEDSFAGINHTEPYTRNNYSLKNFLQNRTAGVAMMSASVTFKFNSGIPAIPYDLGAIVTGGAGSASGRYIAFCLFEINSDDNPTKYTSGTGVRYVTPGNIDPVSGLQNGVMLCKILLPVNGDNFITSVPATPATATTMATPGAILTAPQQFTSIPVTFQINYNKVYVFGIITDIDAGGGSSIYCSFGLDTLKFSLQSYYDNGESGVPIPAPSLNASVFPAMRLGTLLSKLVPNLATTSTDIYGFPIPEATDFNGQSIFLNDSTQDPIGDLVPYNILIASDYCIHDLQGLSYISISLSQLFNVCKKVCGCGLSINGDTGTVSIERLSSFFQDIMIINLDDYQGVANLSIKPFTDGAGANLKLGYSKADTNSDFGVIPINTELYYNTPLYKLASVIDWEESDIIFEENAIEKARAQIVNQPIGEGFDPANPSGANGQLFGFYCLPNAFASPITPYKPGNPPSGNVLISDAVAYPVLQRNGIAPISGYPYPIPTCAQNTDPLAVTNPYINGLYYPDTTINVECSPCRSLERDGGAWIHSMLDNLDDEKLVFRNTGIMQYNNLELPLTGIRSNLEVGAGTSPVVEFADKKISDLPEKLFRPFIFSIETVAPVNMYSIMNSNPNGYVQFTWKGVIFKGFIWSVSQMLSASGKTTFELLAHPTTTNQMMINA